MHAFSSSFQNQFSFWIVKQNTLTIDGFLTLDLLSKQLQKLSDKQDMLPLCLEEEAKTQKTFPAFNFQVCDSSEQCIYAMPLTIDDRWNQIVLNLPICQRAYGTKGNATYLIDGFSLLIYFAGDIYLTECRQII